MTALISALQNAKTQLTGKTDTPGLDAEVLLAHALGTDRAYLRTWPERRLTEHEQQAFVDLIDQRSQGRPVAYLTGHREFWSRSFYVNPDVLIPRPETEQLIEWVLDAAPDQPDIKALDLGTGSGIIALTLALERPHWRITATDVCAKALAQARHNAIQLNIDTVSFIQSDWFDYIAGQRFTIIVGNPPYLAESTPHWRQGDLRFEPYQALVSGPQGLDAIKKITEQAPNHLDPQGWLFLEHGYDQQSAVRHCFIDAGFSAVSTFNDFAGLPRVTCGQII